MTEKTVQNPSEDTNSSPLPGGKTLAQNTLFNLAGNLLPMLVAVVTIPIIIEGIGVERFGVLTLAWMVVGYFSLFDMGLGRATTKFVADYLARDDHDSLREVVWASLLILIFFGLIGAVTALFLTRWLVTDILNISPELQGESIKAFFVLALAVPILTGTAGSRGILEAMQKFKLINYIKIPTYITAFVTPLIILPFSQSLFPIVILLVASRFLGLIAFLIGCFKSIPNLSRFHMPSIDYFKKLLGYGGWLTVSNLIWPVLTYVDRFLIGAILTMSAVAYYTTPYELATKLLIISGSFLGVVFPAFCSYAVNNYSKLAQLHSNAMKYLLLILVPVTFLIICLAKPFFRIWLDVDFAANSTFVLQFLALGILINSVSQVTSSAIQAIGRPDITAKLHLIELPLYLILIYTFIINFGIKGAAIAWVIRVIFDISVMSVIFYKKSPVSDRPKIFPKWNVIIWSLVITAGAFPLAMIQTLYLQLIIITAIIIPAVYYAWRSYLSVDERTMALQLVSSIIHRGKN